MKAIKLLRIVLGSLFLAGTLFSTAQALTIPACPDVSKIKSVPLDVADSEGEQFFVKTRRFIRMNDRQWLVGIGMFDTKSHQEAINLAKAEVMTLRGAITKKAILIEADGNNWWTCSYPSLTNPNVMAMAFSLEDDDAYGKNISTRNMMAVSR